MRHLISVFTNGNYHQYRLPHVDDANYTLHISAARFGLRGDIFLQMEVMGGEWRLLPSENYIIGEKGRNGSLPIHNGSRFSVQSRLGDTVFCSVSLQDDALYAFHKFDITEKPVIRIGKAADNDIAYDYQNLVSKNHAQIISSDGEVYLQDTSTNGVFIGDERIIKTRKLQVGDCIVIFGLKIVFLGTAIAINCREAKPVISPSLPLLPERRLLSESTPVKHSARAFFKRSPRVIEELHSTPVEIEGPPPPNKPKKQPILLTIGPAFTMMIPMLLGSGVAIFAAQSSGGNASIYMYTGIITAGASAVIGGIWAIANLRYSKKSLKEEEQQRLSLYREYLVRIATELKTQYKENTRKLRDRYPSANTVCGYSRETPRLWNRNATHGDFLFVRLGTGSVPFQVPISIPKKGFSLIDDTLTDHPKQLQEAFSVLKQVPVGIDLLERRIVGVFGDGTLLPSIEIAKIMAVQIAASECYTDVKMVFLYDQEWENQLGFVKWLPHVWSEDKKTRYVASNKSEASDVLYMLTGVLRGRAEEERHHTEGAIHHPYYIVFICNTAYLDNEPATKYLLQQEKDLGVTSVILSGSYESLPNCCADLIQNNAEFKGMYDVMTMDAQKTGIRFDTVAASDAETFARRLSGIQVNEMESGSGIVNSLTFFEMHSVNALEEFQVLDRWRKNRTYENMRALIGHKAGGAALYLDIHEKYHGPHGLVAGTTGSGKSETLQTYILSLAINFSPRDVSFFIIDYKGGGMANLFSNLPHAIGTISNLSGNQVRRAMVSIKSEIKRRQRLFSEYAVNHLDMYTRLIKSGEAAIPIPHLLIIIDEFAELKREEPEFMRELISVAQVGRSLGIHLILATQRPAGTVDDNIWSNARFKLCLRVQDRQDSMDMLHRPDAAYIVQAGRCYFQVGNDEIFELFQSGWSGAPYEENMAAQVPDAVTMINLSGQSLLTSKRGKLRQLERRRVAWLHELVQTVLLSAQDTGLEMETCSFEEDRQSPFIEAVFARLSANNSDYPYSPFNAKRVLEFAALLQTQGIVQLPVDIAQIQELYGYALQNNIKLPEIKEKTQLSAVVEYLAEKAKQYDMNNDILLWLPPLPNMLYLEGLPEFQAAGVSEAHWQPTDRQWRLDVQVGLLDDPANQKQMPLVVDIAASGHIAVCGMITSGKSTFLQTLLFALTLRYSPDVLQYYILDYSSGLLKAFEQAPQCGGVVTETQQDKAAKFFAMLKKEINRRKRLFMGGSYAQYIRANGICEPSFVVVIDGYANFNEKTGGAFSELLSSLSREGVGYGIFLLLSSNGFGISEIPNRVAENMKTVYCLQMSDRMKYSDTLRLHVDILPEENTAGRGLAAVNGSILEFQTALCLQASDDYARSEAIKGVMMNLRSGWAGKTAPAIPEIPEQPQWQAYAQLPAYQEMLKTDHLLPLGYLHEDASLYGLNLRDMFAYTVLGKAKSGKSNALRIMSKAALDRGGKVTIIELAEQKLKSTADELSLPYITTEEDLAQFFRGIFHELVTRNEVKNELRAKGLLEDAIYEQMLSFPALYIVISDLASFIQHLYSFSDPMTDIVGFCENFFEKGSLHNIYVFSALSQENYNQVAGRRIFDSIAFQKKGMLLGGNAMGQRYFDMSSLPYQEQNKSYKAGVALLPADAEHEAPYKVILPLFGKGGAHDADDRVLRRTAGRTDSH